MTENDTPAPLTAEQIAAILMPEMLGVEVRRIWIEWANEQPNSKPSWLTPWEELSEPDKEVDRRIGMGIAQKIAVDGMAALRDRLARMEAARDAALALVATQKERIDWLLGEAGGSVYDGTYVDWLTAQIAPLRVALRDAMRFTVNVPADAYQQWHTALAAPTDGAAQKEGTP